MSTDQEGSMMTQTRIIRLPAAFAVATLLIAGLTNIASAKLPPPTPAQQQAQAAKKAADEAQAEQNKQKLAASMEAVVARWRARAAANGWPTHPPLPVAPVVTGFNASASQSGSSGQPDGRQGAATAQAPVRSEKAGTAPPSSDVKQPRPQQ
jgi:hypothetical protein